MAIPIYMVLPYCVIIVLYSTLVYGCGKYSPMYLSIIMTLLPIPLLHVIMCVTHVGIPFKTITPLHTACAVTNHVWLALAAVQHCTSYMYLNGTAAMRSGIDLQLSMSVQSRLGIGMAGLRLRPHSNGPMEGHTYMRAVSVTNERAHSCSTQLHTQMCIN